jgi:glycerol-3-phosphate dehydrogenase (NAD(P)+)
MSIITIIGSGVMGSAMAFPARNNGHTVRLVGTMLDREIIAHARETGFHLNLKRTLPDDIEYYQLEELSSAMPGTELIICGVSSFGVEWFADDIIPVLPENVPVLSITKGMFNLPDGSLISYPKYYTQKAPGRDFCAIGGPCTSYELADHDQTHICFCGERIDTLREMKRLLETPYYHISLTTDVEGLECVVAMKNAYALAVTLAVGLSLKKSDTLHYNSQAALFGQSVREMRALLALFGYSEENIVHGAGDLFVTVFGGRTRKIGTLLGQGYSFNAAKQELSGITLESIVIATRTGEAVRTLIEAGKADKEDFPLLLHIYDIITQNADVNIPWKDFETERVITSKQSR